ncbi:MAG TPA: radical SAM protein [Patescibacteria group bacterium]|nr:radical SAM protein [Patescibacteria group bacterium]
MFDRPYVVSWNLTYRCNLSCEHCYLDAGGAPQVTDDAFSDRNELSTEQCFAVIDDLAAFAPECLTILTGGEPLLRRDILQIVGRAAQRGLFVVVGTNGVRITANLSRLLKDAGARGLSLSLDALDPERHDRFRGVRGAWRNTVEGASLLREAGLPFIVQTTVGAHNLGEIEALADFAHERMQASVWNLYFLVPTGRGQFVSDITPEQYDEVLAALARLQRRYAGRMIVNAKCAPHFVRTLFAEAESAPRDGAGPNAGAGPEAGAATGTGAGPAASSGTAAPPFLKTFSGGAGGCPAGTHYFGIRPNGDVTPCPYLPVFAGNLRRDRLQEIWDSSDLFGRVRARSGLGGRCGECELQPRCGGCRARAYGMTGDLMAEDPLCTHTPGRFAGSPLLRIETPVVYGTDASRTIAWDPDATERIERVPAFVRGMVVKAVEDACRKSGAGRVTLEELDRIRARMPLPKIFGAGPR